jgi:hypothetical protein
MQQGRLIGRSKAGGNPGDGLDLEIPVTALAAMVYPIANVRGSQTLMRFCADPLAAMILSPKGSRNIT